MKHLDVYTLQFMSTLLAANTGGMAIVYLFGITWFYLVSNFVMNAPIPLWTAILYCGIMQAVPDYLLCLAAAASPAPLAMMRNPYSWKILSAVLPCPA